MAPFMLHKSEIRWKAIFSD